MANLVKPKVFLLGYTTADVQGMEDYLKYTKQEDFLQSWQKAKDAGISDGEALCSLYAKLCYKTLVLGKNSNISRTRDIADNLKSCFDTGHLSVYEHCQLNFVVTDCSRVYCYHPDSEVFTVDGWKQITTLTKDEIILTMDPSTRMAHWSPILSMHEFDYEGWLHGWATDECVSPLMTPDHLLWAAKYDLRRARGLRCVENVKCFAEKIPFSELLGKRFVIQHHIVKDDDWSNEEIQIGGRLYDSYDLFTWLGWVATDGSLPRDKPNHVTIFQSKTQNIPGLHKLMDSLFSHRWRRYGPYAGSEILHFTIHDSALADFTRKHIGNDKLTRKFSQWLMDADKRFLTAFFNAAVSGDGTRNRKTKHVTLYCPSYEAAGQWQYIIAKLGLAANLRTDDRIGQSHMLNGSEITNRRLMYQVEVDTRGASLITLKHQINQRYTGKVYCPKTQDGIILVRGTGQPFWCSNTHEQCRHRQGWAYSQTSGRYCRLDSIDLVWDDILDPVKDLFLEHMRLTEDLVYLAECKLGLRKSPNLSSSPPEAWIIARNNQDPNADSYKWIPDDTFNFEKRKILTSAIRYIAPNGQSNEMGMSCNVRALRHTIQLRTARFAAREIRDVYNQIYDLVNEKFPLIFYKAKTRVYDGLREIYGMRMQPYDIEADDPKAIQYYEVSTLEAELVRRKADQK